MLRREQVIPLDLVSPSGLHVPFNWKREYFSFSPLHPLTEVITSFFRHSVLVTFLSSSTPFPPLPLSSGFSLHLQRAVNVFRLLPLVVPLHQRYFLPHSPCVLSLTDLCVNCALSLFSPPNFYSPLFFVCLVPRRRHRAKTGLSSPGPPVRGESLPHDLLLPLVHV